MTLNNTAEGSQLYIPCINKGKQAICNSSLIYLLFTQCEGEIESFVLNNLSVISDPETILLFTNVTLDVYIHLALQGKKLTSDQYDFQLLSHAVTLYLCIIYCIVQEL